MALRLGRFELDEPVASGGMATVWRGKHPAQEVPVAVKVMTGDFAQLPGYQRRFADEVRAAAALNHPGVVMVLDHGRVPAAVSLESGGRLHRGSPWLAMEYASLGTLRDVGQGMKWAEIETVLLALLDALAHAHARDVVHRDIKPDNVLVAGPDDSRPGIKLSDFGIAWARGQEGAAEEDGPVGTPTFMAPEQISGQWRDYGPWTDLYAVGCLCWWLVSGTPPFHRGTVASTLMAHIGQAPPPLRPRIAVPDGLAAWLRRLLAKSGYRRYQAAADAAHDLLGLGALSPPPAPARALPAPPAGLTLTLEFTAATIDPAWPRGGGDDGRPPGATAPMPTSWRRPQPSPPPLRLVGAGLSLYGLREVPLVGRGAERDALWAGLTDVGATGCARAIVLRGPAGTGKSRLARWLCERAHETGAALWARATFGPEVPPGDALQQMGAASFGTTDLPPERVAERVADRLGELGGTDQEIRVLAAMLAAPTMTDMLRGVRGVRFTAYTDYYAATRTGMQRIARDRPLICWLDDVQWGPEGLGLANEILRTRETTPSPFLLVLTLREEGLVPGSLEERLLDKLLEHPACAVVPLGPLPAEHHERLVTDLLGLEGDLAAQVSERTGGNPLFAVQLVGSWVQRGVLRVGRSGFRLGENAPTPALPADVEAVWETHVEEVLADFDDEARVALEIAAVLGHTVRWREWKRATDDPEGHFGERFPGTDGLRAALVERLLTHRLAVGDRRQWSFVHGMLREAIERSAERAGRAATHHAACATLFALSDGPQAAERRGRHLLAAGHPGAAIDPLLEGVRHRLLTLGPHAAGALLQTCVAAMDAAGIAPGDPRRGRAKLLRIEVARDTGDLDDALAQAETLLLEAAAWPDVHASLLSVRAQLLRRQGALEPAHAAWSGLLELARRRDDPGLLGAALLGLGDVARRRGEPEAATRFEDARAAYARALERDAGHASADSWQVGLADCWRASAVVARDAASARAALQEAQTRYRALGVVAGIAECDERLGRLHLDEGQPQRAVADLTEALEAYSAIGSPRAFPCRVRLAIALVRSGADNDRVRIVVEGGRTVFAALDHAGRVATRHAFAVVNAALAEDWNAFLRHFDDTAAVLPRRGRGPGAIAWLAVLAGEVAVRSGRADPARRALGAAAAIWHASGRPELAAEPERAIRALG